MTNDDVLLNIKRHQWTCASLTDENITEMWGKSYFIIYAVYLCVYKLIITRHVN